MMNLSNNLYVAVPTQEHPSPVPPQQAPHQPAPAAAAPPPQPNMLLESLNLETGAARAVTPARFTESLDLETKVVRAAAPESVASRPRTLQEMAAAGHGSGSALRAQTGGVRTMRPPPLLANLTRLCNETEKVLHQQGVVSHHDLIKTAHGARDIPRVQKIANNLILDANLYFEEKLQQTIEHDTYFKDQLEAAVALIHSEIEIPSLATVNQQGLMASDIRAEQLQTIRTTLNGCYTDGGTRLGEMIDNNQWSAAELVELAALQKPGVTGDQRHNANGLLKVYKMIETQKPYFGGSVEYAMDRKDSIEYMIYHLSTLTKNPARQYPPSHEQGHYPKPLKDYQTPPQSLLPDRNQRNLGTGVVESRWTELPVELQREMTERLNAFQREVASQDGHPDTEKSDRLMRIYRGAMNPPAPAPMTHLYTTDFTQTMEQVWQYATEDDRKFIYGDVAQLPWSNAHLHGGDGFEQTFDTRTHGAELNFKHPRVDGPGLQNVAGVMGNVLQTPGIAGEKYVTEMEPVLAQVQAQELAQAQAQLQADFVDKHGGWYESAMQHHKPIIGGISGHTLGYLNLYQEARNRQMGQDAGAPAQNGEKRMPPQGSALAMQGADGPTPEVMRAVMLAGLVGTKRHHSYDEVLAASHQMGDEHNRLQYGDRAGYDDVLHSDNFNIRNCAAQAREQAVQGYQAVAQGTVLNSVLDHVDLQHRQNPVVHPTTATPEQIENLVARRTRISNVMTAYLQSLGEGQAAHAEAKRNVHNTIEDIFAE